ncbi:hypothetical protein [Phenylobacterium sp.]|uniref:hypothetical protein n=1 Tax=Phenylobacterium sp. TaxID=1871053 RepID=UPI0025CF9EED|nr:hypothetical protein [Phenylobacterium sp.]
MLGRCVLIVAVSVAAAAAAQSFKPPRTSFGAPDLQGDWEAYSFTRLQRPKSFKSLTVTDEEAAPWIAEQRGILVGVKPPPKPGEPADGPPEGVGDVESERYEVDHVGLARIDGKLRSSWIVEPTDGKLPYNNFGRAAVEAAVHADETEYDGPEARMPDERCLVAVGSSAGPPILNTAQNSHYKIVQTPTEVAILSEMIHDVRIVRLNAKHPAVTTHPWLGDSIGWWEGDTLVVETVDQNPIAANRFTSGGILVLTPAAKVTERFTRISDSQIRYDFIVDDPAVFTRPWRAEMVLTATTRPLYEYACHEGNYSLPNILGGARQKEREEAEAKKPPSK